MSLALVSIFAVLGVAVGFLSGLLGIGGGFTIVPVLVEVFGREGFAARHLLPMAIGTSAATVIFTTFASARAHHVRGAVDWSIVRLMAPGLVVGSLVGAQIAAALPFALMAAIFGAFTWFTAFRMLKSATFKAARSLPAKPALLGVGTAIGAVAGMVGTGGAFLAVPFLARCNVDLRMAIATSAAMGVPIAAAATLGYVFAGWRSDDLPPWSVGYVYLPAAIAIVIGSMLVAPFGARVAHAWPLATLQRAFAAMLFVLGSYMLWKAFGA
ncbi:MAG TPA: sulfite exporter TauE/SafE family protein [Casimicrobiaceae bacterium]|nr:sulfite exporter TauE/SafE family protein [Casimicrobiaceae bacterium]